MVCIFITIKSCTISASESLGQSNGLLEVILGLGSSGKPVFLKTRVAVWKSVFIYNF